MPKRLIRKKSFVHLQDETAHAKHGFNRALSATNLTTLGIGAIIGAGIFVLTGQAAAQYAGPAIIISFIIAGLACGFAGLCYAEFASLIPISGSAYTYAYATLGEFFAWIIGWDLILEYLFAASTVSVGWSGYLVSFLNDFNLHIPAQLTAATNTVLVDVPGMGWKAVTSSLMHELSLKGIAIDALPQVTALFNLPAVFIIALITVFLVLGIKGTARFNNLMVAVKLFVILLFIAIGFAFVQAHHWTPFIPKNTGEFGHFGWSGIFRGAGVVFFAYIGFDAVSTAAQETKNPARNMPIGILASLFICTILYILVSTVLTGLVSYTTLNVPDPIAVGVNAMGAGMYWLRPIIKIAAIAGLSSVILVMLMGQPRIFFSMADDGLLPPVFAKIHKKFKTPYLGQIFTGVASCILAGILPISALGELVSIGTLLAFVIVCVSVLVLRKTKPELPRPFKTPFVPLVPVLGVAFCLSQMIALPGITWMRLAVWMLIGFIIYFGYGIHRSKAKHAV